STCLPARATSPTAARPANPAPTTITLGASLPATQRLRRLTAPLLPPTAPRTASRPPKVQPPPAREHATTTVPIRRCGHAEAQVRAAPEHAPATMPLCLYGDADGQDRTYPLHATATVSVRQGPGGADGHGALRAGRGRPSRRRGHAGTAFLSAVPRVSVTAVPREQPLPVHRSQLRTKTRLSTPRHRRRSQLRTDGQQQP